MQGAELSCASWIAGLLDMQHSEIYVSLAAADPRSSSIAAPRFSLPSCFLQGRCSSHIATALSALKVATATATATTVSVAATGGQDRPPPAQPADTGQAPGGAGRGGIRPPRDEG
jgi:hypothetical protein